MLLTGECFCGAIKYQINGNVFDKQSCHCSRCRKAFSAQASTYARVNPAEFSWLQGEALLTSFTSQADYGIQFCSRCGSTLGGTYKGSVHGITLGCLKDDPEIEIGYHLYVGSKAAWEVLPSEGIMFQEAPDKSVSPQSNV